MRIVFLIVLDYRCNNDATAMIYYILYCVLSVIQGIALNTGILPFSKGRVLHSAPHWVRHSYLSKVLRYTPYTCGSSHVTSKNICFLSLTYSGRAGVKLGDVD